MRRLRDCIISNRFFPRSVPCMVELMPTVVKAALMSEMEGRWLFSAVCPSVGSLGVIRISIEVSISFSYFSYVGNSCCIFMICDRNSKVRPDSLSLLFCTLNARSAFLSAPLIIFSNSFMLLLGEHECYFRCSSGHSRWCAQGH